MDRQASFRFRKRLPASRAGMSGSGPAGGAGLRYEADERIPSTLALGLGLQLAVLCVAIPILIPTAVMRIGGARRFLPDMGGIRRGRDQRRHDGAPGD